MDAAQRLQSALTKFAQTGGSWNTAGFSLRKRRLLRGYLTALGIDKAIRKAANNGNAQMAWGATHAPYALGADLVRPLSWVFDTRGIYFDAHRASDLEWLLQNRQFTPQELQRASDLRASVLAAGVTKYNVGTRPWQRPPLGGRVVLVVGQVETDASIRLGSHVVQSNTQLLQLARRNCPNDYLVYKPHPDVLAGLRAGKRDTALLSQWCDEIVTDVAMADMLNQVDAVHVITSLAGFEALMRGLDVTCYGTPFYAGWGLCTEPYVLPKAQARRSRRLTLEQLIASTLIDYPSYLHPHTDSLISFEQAVALISDQLGQASAHQQECRLKRLGLALIAKLQGRF
jgi:capsular polysaccharide export protein